MTDFSDTEESPLLETSRWKTFNTRLRYYIPSIKWLRSYNKSDLLHDMIAGLTVAFLLVPQSLSYASALAKLDPIVGLYTAFIPVVCYALLGTSRQLSIGPEALVSILVGSALSKVSIEPTEIMFAVSTLCFLVGLLTLALGIFRLGFVDSVLSRALLCGFTSAVAVVIMIEQAGVLLGIERRGNMDDPVDDFAPPIYKLFFLLQKLHHIHVPTFLVSLAGLVFLIGTAILKKKLLHIRWINFIPEILLLVVLSTAACYSFDLSSQGLDILGRVEGMGTLPFRQLRPGLIPQLFFPATLISIIGFVESVVVAKQYANKYNYAMSPNRELVALGVSNLFGAFLGAYPSFASLARSQVNDRVGARTQLAGLVSGILILFTIYFVLPLFEALPKAIMSSIIFVAAFALIETHDFLFLWKIRAWGDIALLAFTFLSTICISIETGTLISVGLSLVLVVKHTTYPRLTVLGRIQGTDKFKSIKEFPGEAVHIPGILIIKVEESLYFGNTGQLKDRLRRIENFGDMNVHPSEDAYHPAIHSIIFEVENMQTVDATAMQILMEVVAGYKNRNVEVCFSKLREVSIGVFNRSGLSALVGHHCLFRKTANAVDYLQSKHIQDV